MMPDCSFEELIPIFLPDTPETTFDLETRTEILRNLQDSFTVHTRRIHNGIRDP